MNMDIKSREARSRNMAKIRSRDTKPELYIRSLLFRQGLRYRVNHTAIDGKPDLYFPKYRVAVFIHGCFWHRHEGCKYAYMPKTNMEFWSIKFNANKTRDERVILQLISSGFRVLVIWECTISRMMHNEDYCYQICKAILNFITVEKSTSQIV